MSILDETDRNLLALLQKNDRLSLAEIGQELKLAPSTVNDRIKRLIRNEIISGFHAAVNPEKVGLDLLAFVFVGWNDPAVETAFLKKVAESGSVLECHHVTGAWNYLMKVRLKNTRELERFLAQDLKSIEVPTLVMHGEDDQIVPVKDSAKKSAKLIKGAAEIYYPGLSHGLTATHPDLINRDLLAFCQQGKRQVA